jgi:hypothetical protein
MQLKISHVTDYTYAQPVRYALQRLRTDPAGQPAADRALLEDRG